MSKVFEQIQYIQGMMDGMKLNKEDDTVKLLGMMLNAVRDLSEQVDQVEADQQELSDYVESIDDDLAELESCHDEDFENYDDEEFDFSEKHSSRRGKLSVLKPSEEDDEDDAGGFRIVDDEDDEEYDYEAETEFYIGCVCPECGKFFSVKNPDQYTDDQKFVCPFCKKHVVLSPMDPESVPCAEPVEE